MSGRLPLVPALGEALVFVPRAWAGAWGALALFAAALAAPLWLTAFIPAPWLSLIVAVVAPIAGLVAQGALYRLGVSPTFDLARRRGLGLGGLQLGRLELNLLIAGLMVAGFLALVAAAGALVLVFLASAVRLDHAALHHLSLGPQGIELGPWLFFAATCGLVWTLAQLAIRLSLYKAATAARGRPITLDALALSTHHFWALFAGLVLVCLPAAGVLWLRLDPELIPLDPRMAGTAQALVLALIQLPLGIGFLCSAYKRVECWTGD